MLREICVIALLVAGARTREIINQGGNEVFDVILEKLNDLDDVRIMALDDLEFSSKIAHLLRAEAKLHDGVVTGLDTSHRIGNASVDLFDDGSVNIKGTLGMGVIGLSYRGTLTFMKFGPSIEMNSKTGYIEVDAEIVYDSSAGVQVKTFQIRNFEALRVRFSGLGIITWISNLLVAPAVQVLNPIIKKVVEVEVRGIIEKKLPAILESIDLSG